MTRQAPIPYLAGAASSVGPVRAGQKPLSGIGFLGKISAGSVASFVTVFQQGLADTGYAAGRSVAVEYRRAEGQSDRLPALAIEVANRNVEVIVATGSNGTAATKATAPTMPVVFIGGGDLVAAGFVASFAHADGEFTGIGLFGPELGPKRLYRLSEVSLKQRWLFCLRTHTAPSPKRRPKTPAKRGTRKLCGSLSSRPAA